MIIQDKKERKEIENKEITVITKTKEKIEGIVVSSKDKENVKVAISGDWSNTVNLNLNETLKFTISEFDYYDLQHKTFLRESKTPQFKFRFKKEELDKLLNSYLSVNYDGKVIEGKFKKYSFIRNKEGFKNAVLVIENNFEVQEIEDYRLRDLSIIGRTELEYKQFLKLYELESELRLEFEEKYDSEFIDFSSRTRDPDSMLEDYFLNILELMKNGSSDYDLEEYRYNWISEVMKENKSKQSENFSEDLHKSKLLTEYYNCRKDFILYMVNYVSKINWTPLFGSQKNGEIKALTHLHEANLISQ